MNKQIKSIVLLTMFFVQLPIWGLTFIDAQLKKYIFWAEHGRTFELLPWLAKYYFYICSYVIIIYLICNLIVCILLLKKKTENIHIISYICLSILSTVFWFSFYYLALANLDSGVLSTGPLVPNDWSAWGI